MKTFNQFTEDAEKIKELGNTIQNNKGVKKRFLVKHIKEEGKV